MSFVTASLRCVRNSSARCRAPAGAFRSSVRDSLSVGTFQRKIHDEADVSGTLRREPTNSALPYLRDADEEFMEGQSVVVIGAGPAGTCAAMSLANAGSSVVVYERRSESTFVEDEGEPYAIVLEKRALGALLDAGFLDADFHGSTYLGSVRVDTDGKPVAFQAESDALACERRELAESLRKHAAASNPAKIAFKFGYECIGGDLENGGVTFRDSASGDLKPASFDLLIGADGQCSRVRDLLEDQVPHFTVNRERSGRVLHSFTGLSPHHEIVLEPTEWRDAEECDDGRSLILWTSRTPGITLSMHRRPDGTFSGVFGGNQDIFETIDREAADKAPEAFRSSADAEATVEQRKADVRRWIQAWRQGRSAQHGGAAQEHAVQQQAVELRPVDVHRAHAYSTMLCKAFAGLPEDWAEAIAQQAVDSSFVPEPDSIKCSQLHGPRTVLIGDAAHCAAPVLGQGANAALEDVSVLVDTLRRMHELRRNAKASNTDDAMHDVAAFTRARKHDVHALIDLNRCVLAEFCTHIIATPWYMVGATEFGPFAALAFLPLLVHVTFGHALSLLPWVGQPAVTQISQGIPYSRVVNSILRDFAIFLCGLAAIVFALCFAR